jgi:hypothetical protein
MERRCRRYSGPHQRVDDYRKVDVRAARGDEGGGIVEKGADGIPTMDVSFSPE